MALADVSLDDRYQLETGRIFLTGTQALARLLLTQRRRDAAAGLNTAGYVSGYRGSPLGGLDRELWRIGGLLAEHHIRFQPGVNEDLAATALWGTQQSGLFPGARYDGVFGLWYGKGPGVDRSGDAFRHANLAGTAPHGGVLAVTGDDPACKASTAPSQSEHALIDAGMPVLVPADIGDFLDFGLYGWALSRFSGCWVGMKTQGDNVDASTSIEVTVGAPTIVRPEDFASSPGGLHIRLHDWPPTIQDSRLYDHKLAAARAFARANALDRVVMDGPTRRIGVVAAGKAFLDVLQALDDLGIDHALASAIGLSAYKVAMAWPLDTESAQRFCDGLQEILVVEEKRPLLEPQLKEMLYHRPADRRPRIVGKVDENGKPLLPATGALTPMIIARAIARRVERFDPSGRVGERVALLELIEDAALHGKPSPARRLPYFCSGCPHNTSTVVPDGSTAAAGIGCHFMVTWMDRKSDTFTQMGGEGANWNGMAPFTDIAHQFVNIGDGTYFHSGILAIRAAVAARVNVTYKILYNDAVAMTGGQPMDGPLDVPMITRQMAAEGVGRIAIVSDEPQKFAGTAGLAPGVSVGHRDDLDAVQRELRDVPGTSVLIYDQTCAAEKRRRRKRGRLPDPPKRVFINEAVCEGCGDCGVVSNCVSIVPKETALGRKRAIDQSSCNKDYSCVKGFCPSFVTVHGAEPRRRAPAIGDLPPAPPDPELPALDAPYGIVIAGIGGTGVVTIGALLGMAAHLEGKGVSVIDQTGLAQKNGTVVSHLRFAARPSGIRAMRLSVGGARLILGCDMVAAAGADVLATAKPDATRAIVNAHQTMTADFTHDPDLRFPATQVRGAIEIACGPEHADFVEATRLGTSVAGDTIAANLLLLGYAYQEGLVPVSGEAILRGIELNGAAVTANQEAFLWGRRCAHDPALAERILGKQPGAPTLDEMVATRVAELRRYQDDAYAERYTALLARVRATEAERAPGKTSLAEAAARSYHKLLAYKDEYEVARLYSDGRFGRALADAFNDGARLRFHLAPPLFARRDPVTGVLRKKTYGPWVMRVFRSLARLKGLRGTRFDVFGYTAERRMERRLIGEYEATVNELLSGLDRDNHALAREIASLPETMRGFGHVKAANVAAAKTREAELLELFRAPTRKADAAQ